MNTGLLRHAVATVLTVYGIETNNACDAEIILSWPLQQCLPFTVLKLRNLKPECKHYVHVATVLTVYGIETFFFAEHSQIEFSTVATVLTVYGIETHQYL